MPIDQGWRLSRRGLPLDLSDRTEVWPQVAHELTDRQGMEPELFCASLSLAFEFLCPQGPNLLFELLERVTDNSLTARDGHFAAGYNSKNTAVYGAKGGSAIGRSPAQNGRNQDGQQIRVPG